MYDCERLEDMLEEHVLFMYHYDAKSLDSSILREIYKHTQKLNDYDTINIVIHTKGGNLGVGAKIMHMLREKYKVVNSIVIDQCSSTGSFMAVCSDNLLISHYALITPAEPKMSIYDDNNTSISVSNIRNLIEYNNGEELDSIILSNYLATNNYYKDLCYKLNDKEKADKIINYMLNEINSHQYPLDIDELNRVVNTRYLNKVEEREFEKIHNEIMSGFDKNNSKEKVLTVLLSKNILSKEEKVYDDNKEKIREGYSTIERKEEHMKNIRIQDIFNEDERTKVKKVNSDYSDSYYNDAYTDSSYTDSVYRDVYLDTVYADSIYRDAYEDSYQDSYEDSYHDSYHDSYLDTYNNELPQKKLVKAKKTNKRK